MQTETETEFSALDFESPPPFPEAELPDTATLQALHEIEQLMQEDSGLPTAPVSDFPSPMMTVMFSLHRLPLLSAHSAAEKVLAQAASKLPKGSKPDRAVDTLHPVFVPRWFLKGEISGAWQASGIVTSNWEIDCTQCFGTGKLGVGTNQRNCDVCWGTGKQKQVKKETHVEQGEGSVSLMDSLDNNGTGIVLGFKPEHDALPWLLPDEERMRLRCLRPAGIYSSSALDHLKNRLASTLGSQCRENLKHYSRVEHFKFDPESVRSNSAVGVWLYPAYISSFHVPEGRGYVFCDAVSGEANWALGLASEQEQVSSSSRLPLIAGGLGGATLIGAAAAWYFLNR